VGLLIKCCLCGIPADHVHHVFPGTGKRKLCETYEIKVPLCHHCHGLAHGMKGKFGYSQEVCKEKFCNILGIDYNLCLRAINNADHITLKIIREQIIKNKGSNMETLNI